MAAAASPAVVLAGRPAAERAPDAWTGWFAPRLLFKLAIQYNGGFAGSDGRTFTSLGEQAMLTLHQFDWSRAFLIVVRHVVDPLAHGIAPHCS